jgi:hypothetical protein
MAEMDTPIGVGKSTGDEKGISHGIPLRATEDTGCTGQAAVDIK